MAIATRAPEYASEEKWAEQTAADLVLRAFDKYQQGGSPVETTRCKSTPTPAEIVPATPARQFVPEPAEEMATPLAVNKSMQEELSVLSAKLATAEKQTVELRREEVDKAAHIAALTAQHEVEMVDLQKQLKAKQQELELELAKAKNAPTPKKSKICEIQ
ncbi:hypothetical protein T492DRAFT_1065250 [Pavlovales sp. CCMP2436]|nr:hypothetical protein T492DRAFT_1065250 [Pavlovales sp. CCMP2436]|mmetsp:Transcript_29507/g.74133  ORF Transcript_29507/g.74133 Transcript_29507/m.74133 type:complete len:160 (+) Transcript_29507:54-533(+)